MVGDGAGAVLRLDEVGREALLALVGGGLAGLAVGVAGLGAGDGLRVGCVGLQLEEDGLAQQGHCQRQHPQNSHRSNPKG